MVSSPNANKHLTQEQRITIMMGITNGSKATIAKVVGKDKSTISKEIKAHRTASRGNNLPVDCANYQKCKNKPLGCSKDCKNFIEFTCKRRDVSPGACNGCSSYSRCHHTKYRYDAVAAQREYKANLVDSRQGFNLTSSEAKKIGDVVAPLIKQGLSPYHILETHPEITVSERTLYNYIEGGVFKNTNDLISLDLRRQTSRKITSKRSQMYKKRDDRRFLKGRTYSDFIEYTVSNSIDDITDMDTVYNSEEGPFIQTFKFIKFSFFYSVYHERKFAECMVDGVDRLESILGKELFEKYVRVIKTDRGGEFVSADAIENRSDGSLRTKVFYCDPMCSHQKGSLENKHIELRYILPKGKDLKALGLTNQEKMDLVTRQLNSYALKSLNGKTAFEFLEFCAPDLYQKFVEAGISPVPSDEVILSPALLK